MRKGGRVSIPGVYGGFADKFPLGAMMEKGLQIRTGQTHVQRYTKDLLERIKTALDDQVQEVRVTNRLTDSPACLVVGQFDMGAQMKKIMEAAGQKVPESKPIFEINVDHPLVQRLESEQGEECFRELSAVLFDQATLASGEQLKDPGAYVSRLNRLLLELAN